MNPEILTAAELASSPLAYFLIASLTVNILLWREYKAKDKELKEKQNEKELLGERVITLAVESKEIIKTNNELLITLKK